MVSRRFGATVANAKLFIGQALESTFFCALHRFFVATCRIKLPFVLLSNSPIRPCACERSRAPFDQDNETECVFENCCKSYEYQSDVFLALHARAPTTCAPHKSRAIPAEKVSCGKHKFITDWLASTNYSEMLSSQNCFMVFTTMIHDRLHFALSFSRSSALAQTLHHRFEC